MRPLTLDDNLEITSEFDAAEDAFHIFLGPNLDDTFFVSLENQPDIFLRRRYWAFRLAGISVKPASGRLGSKSPSEAAMRRLAKKLVARYVPIAESLKVKKRQRPLGEKPWPAWDYDAFQDTLYIDMETDARNGDYRVARDQPDVVLRHDPGDGRLISLFEERVARHLGTDMPTDGQLRALASELVARYAPDA